MESFIAELEAQRIAELEAQRIAELEAYLLATGLRDYTLTAEEERVVREFECGEFEKVRIGDVFEVKTVRGFDEGKLELMEQKQTGCLEFIGRTRSNNGIKGYVQELSAQPNPRDVISVSQIGTIVAQIRKEEWYGSQNIFSLSQKSEYEDLMTLYSVSVVNVSLGCTFSEGYSNYPTLDKLKDLVIQIPMRAGKPDYATMKTLISAVQKLVIRDVVLYADRKIEATREVIKRE